MSPLLTANVRDETLANPLVTSTKLDSATATDDNDNDASLGGQGEHSNVQSEFQCIPLALDTDTEFLTEYQCLLRMQLELFESDNYDVRSTSPGRNMKIVPGQIGLRCRHCSSLPIAARTKGAVYYSQTIDAVSYTHLTLPTICSV